MMKREMERADGVINAQARNKMVNEVEILGGMMKRVVPAKLVFSI